jgi:hypothetical protein
MSFHVHPAPRIRNEPIAQAMNIHASYVVTVLLLAKIAKIKLHQHGSSKSQVPTGRSARDKRKYGRVLAGQ